MKKMWEINVIRKDICDLTGVLIGVTVSTDNGDTQYLTVNEYDKLIESRRKKSEKQGA